MANGSKLSAEISTAASYGKTARRNSAGFIYELFVNYQIQALHFHDFRVYISERFSNFPFDRKECIK